MGYEKLLIEADNQNLIVKEKKLITKDGMCYKNRIAINKNLRTDKEKYCVLSEELGHYNLTVGDISKLKTINDYKQELKARRWGYKHIVSLEGIIEAINHNCINRYEVAEYLGVTDKYFCECIEDYRKQYGMSVTLGKYTLMFEPSFCLYINFEWK